MSAGKYGADHNKYPSSDNISSDPASSNDSSITTSSISPVAAANVGNALSVAGDVPVSSFASAMRFSAQLVGSLARTSVIWLNHLLRIFAPVYRMPLKSFRPVQMRPFDNIKQRAWAHYIDQGKIKVSIPPSHTVSPTAVVDGSLKQGESYQRINAVKAIRTVYAAEGFLALIHHLSPALFGNILLGTVMFTAYEAAIRVEHELIIRYPESTITKLLQPMDKPSITSVSSATNILPPVSYTGILIAGAWSGFCQSIIATPLQNVNTHYDHFHYLHVMSHNNPQTTTNDPIAALSVHPSHHHSLRRIYQYEGIKGIFRGLKLTSVRDTIGMSVFFGTFQASKSALVRNEHFSTSRHEDSWFRRELGWSHSHIWNSFAIVLSGIAAGLIYRTITHPFVVLQHRRDRDYLIYINDYNRYQMAKVPLLCFSHTTNIAQRIEPIYKELFELYKKDGLKFLTLKPLQSFTLPTSIPSFLNRLTFLLSPSVVGLLTYELTKMHQQNQRETHQH